MPRELLEVAGQAGPPALELAQDQRLAHARQAAQDETRRRGPARNAVDDEAAILLVAALDRDRALEPERAQEADDAARTQAAAPAVQRDRARARMLLRSRAQLVLERLNAARGRRRQPCAQVLAGHLPAGCARDLGHERLDPLAGRRAPRLEGRLARDLLVQRPDERPLDVVEQRRVARTGQVVLGVLARRTQVDQARVLELQSLRGRDGRNAQVRGSRRTCRPGRTNEQRVSVRRRRRGGRPFPWSSPS